VAVPGAPEIALVVCHLVEHRREGGSLRELVHKRLGLGMEHLALLEFAGLGEVCEALAEAGEARSEWDTRAPRAGSSWTVHTAPSAPGLLIVQLVQPIPGAGDFRHWMVVQDEPGAWTAKGKRRVYRGFPRPEELRPMDEDAGRAALERVGLRLGVTLWGRGGSE
jgi:hypothetical protein